MATSSSNATTGPVLAVDTCGTEGSVQLFDGATRAVLAQATLPGRETQEKLLPAIASVLAEAGVDFANLAALAVLTGPGSFTGVRIGIAAVKGLAEALNLPVVALSRLAVLRSALQDPQGRNVYALLEAGRGDVYSVNGKEAEALVPLQTVLTRVREDEVLALLEPALFDSVRNALPEAVLVSSSDYQRSFRDQALRALQAGAFADVLLLDANYLRKPDAELALNARMVTVAEQNV